MIGFQIPRASPPENSKLSATEQTAAGHLVLPDSDRSHVGSVSCVKAVRANARTMIYMLSHIHSRPRTLDETPSVHCALEWITSPRPLHVHDERWPGSDVPTWEQWLIEWVDKVDKSANAALSSLSSPACYIDSLTIPHQGSQSCQCSSA